MTICLDASGFLDVTVERTTTWVSPSNTRSIVRTVLSSPVVDDLRRTISKPKDPKIGNLRHTYDKDPRLRQSENTRTGTVELQYVQYSSLHKISLHRILQLYLLLLLYRNAMKERPRSQNKQ